ncbi:hypothetical protein [Falsarthrobacter nasiphocae]|uniref:Uncharacterized protein n=1 Tax=Falsarthrobacter nasiphocae TaxID=189863 RepID=A0AAE3YHG3_9MICC|nr:hypothetical protein [Falsarthrobacter nasiphocae]MDR6892091.1 hypothetical protein [Falsarthrobacter nasiphocae]
MMNNTPNALAGVPQGSLGTAVKRRKRPTGIANLFAFAWKDAS